MSGAENFAVFLVLGCLFCGGMVCASGLWGLHCRTVRKRFAKLEETVAELENERNLRRLEKGKKTLDPDGVDNALKQLHRRLNSLTDVVDEVRNGTFTMQWEKKEAQNEH